MCLPHPVAALAAAQVAPHASRPNLILFLGRLEAAKGIFDLLEAVAALRAAVPDVRLVCAGDGNRIAVARYAERLGIADAVKFTGWVGPSGKRALLETAAVFALPSYREALPIGLARGDGGRRAGGGLARSVASRKSSPTASAACSSRPATRRRSSAICARC